VTRSLNTTRSLHRKLLFRGGQIIGEWRSCGEAVVEGSLHTRRRGGIRFSVRHLQGTEL
jgi:hypothetical protein